MKKNSESDLSFGDLFSSFSHNFFKILKNPRNKDAYLAILNDATYNSVKFFFEPTLKQEASNLYSKRKQAYISAGITEDDIYHMLLAEYRKKYRELIDFYYKDMPVIVRSLIIHGDLI